MKQSELPFRVPRGTLSSKSVDGLYNIKYQHANQNLPLLYAATTK